MSAESAVQYFGAAVSALTIDSIPADVLEKARCALLHNLSVAVAGGSLATVVSEWAKRKAGRQDAGSRTFIAGVSLSPGDAAFANASLTHARAQDDVYFPGLTHIGAATIPAVLALAESRGKDLGDILVALVCGYEVAAAISERASKLTTTYGFRATGIYGVFGSAAASAKLLGLSADQTSHALAIAAAFASGTNQTWVDSSLEWQLEVGAASRSGLDAALFAEAGATGAPGALEGKAGFFAAFARDAGLADGLVGSLEDQWRLRSVTFKPYPVCAILQAPVRAAIGIRATDGAELQRASLRLCPAEAEYPGTRGEPPFDDPGAALMSASYCLALALEGSTVRAADLFRSGETRLREVSRLIEVISDSSLSAQSFVLEVDFGGADIHLVEHTSDGSAFNWDRDELLENIRGLGDELPDGFGLAPLIEACLGELSLPAHRLVDTLVA